MRNGAMQAEIAEHIFKYYETERNLQIYRE